MKPELKDMSITELKALGFDINVDLAKLQNYLNAVMKEIDSREPKTK